MTDMIHHGQVKLPASYYAKAKNEYADWRIAWFREAIQNELDAGATHIDFTICPNAEDPGLTRVVCHGDGRGMDEHKLFNVFLALGQSEKEEGSIGGFGYAKVILAFAHTRYEVETKGIHLKGAGGSYSWTTGNETMPGVRLTADMPKEEAEIWMMEDSLRRLIHHSRLPSAVKITLNGESLACGVDDHPYTKQTPLGPLSFKDQPHGYSTSLLWVRMRGLAMFNERLYMSSGTAFEGYLELEGDSKDLMTSNRDSLNRNHRDVLNQIMQQLSNDREKLKLSGDIDILLNERNISAYGVELENEIREAAYSKGMDPEQMLTYLEDAADEVIDGRAQHPFGHLVGKINRVKNQLDAKINKIPSEWYPENFKVKYLDESSSPEGAHQYAGEIAQKMNLKRYGKLAAGWEAIINTLLESKNYRESLRVVKRGNAFFHEDLLIHTGFVFGSPEGICQRDEKAKRVAILFNPKVAEDEKLSVGDLIDIAHHELTHLDIDYHGEAFTIRESRLRRIMRRDIGEREIISAFENAVSGWREAHSVNKSSRRKTKNQLSNDETGLNP